MSERIDDGGPAFPVSTRRTDPIEGEEARTPYSHQDSPITWTFGGMTLRDYFAAHAPVTPLAVIQADPWTWAGHLQCLDVIEKEIWWRWHYADKMLAARSKPPRE